ncbi:hypothetical protein [Methylobacter sp. YRD-M1]|uniref:hypothetical protein n=1 Tax=Methylobacter sp. YRD-M1 TaxID=2911520 RepID=UPI00227BB18E|nr:hypothetical protein [Methylobacter sp. YRD-M1]WAK04024.1 hypothetical protein LZ558_09625 [Methylobacter sp. YRD-M1]
MNQRQHKLAGLSLKNDKWLSNAWGPFLSEKFHHTSLLLKMARAHISDGDRQPGNSLQQLKCHADFYYEFMAVMCRVRWGFEQFVSNPSARQLESGYSVRKIQLQAGYIKRRISQIILVK